MIPGGVRNAYPAWCCVGERSELWFFVGGGVLPRPPYGVSFFIYRREGQSPSRYARFVDGTSVIVRPYDRLLCLFRPTDHSAVCGTGMIWSPKTM